MTNLEYTKFIARFKALDSAKSLIYQEGLETKASESRLNEVQQALGLFSESYAQDYKPLMSEIESNFYSFDETARRAFIRKVIRDLRDIGIGLNYGNMGTQLGRFQVWHNNLRTTNIPTPEGEIWLKPTEIEKYLHRCFFAYRNLFCSLDILCNDYGIDIAETQDRMGIMVWYRDNRSIDELINKGIKGVRPHKSDWISLLLFDSSTDNSRYTVKSLLLAYYYMSEKKIYPIQGINQMKVEERSTKLHELHGFSAASFNNDWNSINRYESSRVANSKNLELAIEYMETLRRKFPNIDEPIKLAIVDLEKSKLKK